MPLFNYKCKNCEQVTERFQHNLEAKVDIICKQCDSTEFERLPSCFHNRTWLNSRENLSRNILPDAERIRKDILKGKDSAFCDIYGESS